MISDASPPNQSPANAPDWDAIARFLAGESSVEEAASVQRWLDANPVEKDLVARLDAAVTTDPGDDIDVESALARVHARMDTAPRMDNAGQRPKLSLERGAGPARWRTMTVGALLAAAAIAGVLFTIRPSAPVATTPVASTAHIYTTRVGQRDSVLLADGSRVLLGPDSRLTVPADYGTTSRAVELHGDGYFDVQHDAAKPFAVRVGTALIEDIGTTFTVESDAGDTTSVAVVTGSIRLRGASSSPNAGVVLAAGDRGSIDQRGNVRFERQSVRDDDVAWTTGRLVFRDASLTRVAGEIHRWYGVTLRVTDPSLLNRHVTASFAGEPIDQVLKILGLTLGARVDHQGDSAIVTSTRGPNPAR
jgi:transmembrane sensor